MFGTNGCFFMFQEKVYLPDSCIFQFELGFPCTRFLNAYAYDHICITILDILKFVMVYDQSNFSISLFLPKTASIGKILQHFNYN